MSDAPPEPAGPVTLALDIGGTGLKAGRLDREGAMLGERWRNWLRHDPVKLVTRYAGNLRRLAGVYIDCGWRDQYQIHYGSRQLSRALTESGIAHRYEEFYDDHSDVDYRMDTSLPYLYRALQP